MKRLIKLLVVAISSFIFLGNVNAATAKFNVTSSSSQVIVGNSVTVYVTVSSSIGLGSWEYTLNYNSSLFKLKSSDVGLHYAAAANNSNTKSVTYKYVFTSLKSGSAKFYVDSTSAITFTSEDVMSVSNGSKTISAISYAEYQASLSSNNYLKALSVDGQALIPEFNKDTTEYLVQVNEDTKSIKINATPADTTAKVNGLGTFEVTSGNNAFEIVVVAQNGSERTYKIIVEVLDKNPINVEVDGEKYTVVKIKENLKKPDSYEEKTITIKDMEVPAFYSTVTKFTLVGLKDSQGQINLYKYNDGKYEKYTELIFGNLTIYPIELDKSVESFTDAKISIQNNELNVLKNTKNGRYYLVAGLNVETGEEGLYLYDEKDQSLIHFDKESFDEANKQTKILMIVLLAFGVTTFGFFIIILCMLHKNSKLKKIIKNSKKKEVKKSEKVEKKEKTSKKVETDEK